VSAAGTPPEQGLDPRDAQTPPCPRCGAELTADQDWCLECGAAVTTQVSRSPGWRLPAAIAGTVAVLAAAVLVFAFLDLSGDGGGVAAEPTPTPTPVAEATPTPEATPEALPEEDPGAAVPPPAEPPLEDDQLEPEQFGEEGVQEWPSGEEAWTVVLMSATSREEADASAQEFTDEGTPAGVLRSDDYESLRPGYWVVFSGQYDTREEAEDAAQGIGAGAAGAYARFVEPR
jgi:hypothetical protein